MTDTTSTRRQSPRIQVDADVRVEGAGVQRRIGGRLLNLGAGGAFVELDDGYPVGTCLRVRFKLAMLGEISCRVIVRHNIEGKGVGVEFLDLEGTEQERLLALIAEHQT